jgi:hypothetical protein
MSCRLRFTSHRLVLCLDSVATTFGNKRGKLHFLQLGIHMPSAKAYIHEHAETLVAHVVRLYVFEFVCLQRVDQLCVLSLFWSCSRVFDVVCD